MREVVRILLLGVAVSTAAAAEDFYRDNAHNFEILQPVGWTVQPEPPRNHFRISFRGPNYARTGENCSVAMTSAPPLGITQAQINTHVRQGAVLQEQMREWNQATGQNIKVLSHAITTLSGLPAQGSVDLLQVLGPGGVRVPMKVRDITLLVPEHAYMIECGALLNGYDDLQPELDHIQFSFRLSSPKN